MFINLKARVKEESARLQQVSASALQAGQQLAANVRQKAMEAQEKYSDTASITSNDSRRQQDNHLDGFSIDDDLQVATSSASRERRLSTSSNTSFDPRAALYEGDWAPMSSNLEPIASDVESTFTDVDIGSGSKEQLSSALHQHQTRAKSYKDKYRMTAKMYNELIKEHQRMKAIVATNQDKLMQRLTKERDARKKYQQENESLTQGIDEQKVRVNKLQDLLEKCKVQIDSDRAKRQQLEKELEETKQANKNQASDNGFGELASGRQIDEWKAKYEELNKTLQAYKTKAEEEKLMALAETKRQMHEQLEEKDEQLNKATQQKRNLDSEVAELKLQHAQVVEQLTALSDAAKIADEIKISKADVEAESAKREAYWQKKVDELALSHNSEKDLLNRHWEEKLTEEREQSMIQIEEREQQKVAALLKSHGMIDQLQHSIEELKTEKMQLESKLAEQKITNQQAYTNYADQIEKLRAEHAKEIESARVDAEEKRKVTCAYADAEAKLHETKEEIQLLRTDKQAKDEELKQLRQCLQNEKELAREKMYAHANEIEMLRETLANLMSKDAEDSDPDLTSHVGQLVKRLQSFETEQKRLTSQIESTEKVMELLRKQSQNSDSKMTLEAAIKNAELHFENVNNIMKIFHARATEFNEFIDAKKEYLEKHSSVQQPVALLAQSSSKKDENEQIKVDSISVDSGDDSEEMVVQRKTGVLESAASTNRDEITQLKTEIQMLQIEVSKLEKQRDELSVSFFDKESLLAETNNLLIKLNDDLASEQERVKQLEDQNECLTTEMRAYRLQIENLQESVDEKDIMLERVKNETVELQEELDSLLQGNVDQHQRETESSLIAVDEQLAMSSQQAENENNKQVQVDDVVAERDQLEIELKNQQEFHITQITQLESHNKKLDIERSDLQKQLDSLISEQEQKNHTDEQQKNELAQLENIRTELMARNEELALKIEELKQEAELLSIDKDQLQASLDTLTQKFETVNDEKNQLQTQLDANQQTAAELSRLQHEINNADSTLDEIRSERNNLLAEIAKLRNHITELETQNEQSKIVIDDLSNSELEMKRVKAQDIESHRSQIENLEKTLAEQKQQIEDIQKTKEQMTTNATKEKEKCELTVANLRDEINTLKNKTNDYVQLEESIAEKTSIITQLKQIEDKRIAEIKLLEEKLAQERENNAALQRNQTSAVAELQDELERLQQQSAESETKTEEMKSQLESQRADLKEQLERKSAKIAELEAELSDTSALDRLIEENATKLKELETKLWEKYESELRQLRKQLDEQATSSNDNQQDMRSLYDQINEKTQALSAIRDEYDDKLIIKENELNDLHAQLSELKLQLEEKELQLDASPVHQPYNNGDSPMSLGMRSISLADDDGEKAAINGFEAQYLRNVMFRYMLERETLGKECVSLARVIAKALKYNQDHASQIVAKEESRQHHASLTSYLRPH